MRLRLFDRIRRLAGSRRPPAEAVPGVSTTQGKHRRSRRGRGPATGPGPPGGTAPGGTAPPAELAHTAAPWPGGPPAAEAPFPSSPGPRQGAGAGRGPGAVRAGAARARIREAPSPATGPVSAAPALQARGQETTKPAGAAVQAEARSADLARIAAGIPRQPDGPGRSSWRPAVPVADAGLPYAAAHPREHPRAGDGRRNCGSLEAVLWRQWDPASPPPREVVLAVDRLAELPFRIREKLADALDAIFIGPGGVPELDDMTGLRGVPLPSGQATWDACAGAYGERKIVVGSRPSPTPDVMCHEVGHALDDIDSPPGTWQSDSAEFRVLYDRCEPKFASDFHRQPGGLGRKEFFADAFAAIASRQRPALVDMLSGDTRTALQVMLYFNRRYGI
jgi:hypothetical protein